MEKGCRRIFWRILLNLSLRGSRGRGRGPLFSWLPLGHHPSEAQEPLLSHLPSFVSLSPLPPPLLLFVCSAAIERHSISMHNPIWATTATARGVGPAYRTPAAEEREA